MERTIHSHSCHRTVRISGPLAAPAIRPAWGSQRPAASKRSLVNEQAGRRAAGRGHRPGWNEDPGGRGRRRPPDPGVAPNERLRPRKAGRRSWPRSIELRRRGAGGRGITRRDIAAAGIGSPGPLDVKSGTILFSANLNVQEFPDRARAGGGVRAARAGAQRRARRRLRRVPAGSGPRLSPPDRRVRRHRHRRLHHFPRARSSKAATGKRRRDRPHDHQSGRAPVRLWRARLHGVARQQDRDRAARRQGRAQRPADRARRQDGAQRGGSRVATSPKPLPPKTWSRSRKFNAPLTSWGWDSAA